MRLANTNRASARNLADWRTPVGAPNHKACWSGRKVALTNRFRQAVLAPDLSSQNAATVDLGRNMAIYGGNERDPVHKDAWSWQ